MAKRYFEETGLEASNPPSVAPQQPETKRAKLETSVTPQILPPTAFTKWTLATIPKNPPPLPEILDPKLEQAALTHSGMRQSLSDPSYERLEWIGDVYLEMIASELIWQTFPDLEPGKCSMYRELLVRNSTLGQFSIHYGLDQKANFPPEFGLGGRKNGTAASEQKRAKALGDIFEAYIGAVVRSDPENGFKRAAQFMKDLWGPVLERQIREEESRHGGKGKGPNGNSVKKDKKNDKISFKTQLEQLIGAPGVKIEYKDLPSSGKKDRVSKQPLYTVGCFLHGWGESGLQLGHGSALGKKEAGQKAAEMALNNKKLIKKFAEKRKAFMEARAAQLKQQQEQQQQQQQREEEKLAESSASSG